MTPQVENPVDLNQLSVEARQLAHLYLSIDQETFNSGTCEQQDRNVRERNHT
jgi:hypothetical protein